MVSILIIRISQGEIMVYDNYKSTRGKKTLHNFLFSPKYVCSVNKFLSEPAILGEGDLIKPKVS